MTDRFVVTARAVAESHGLPDYPFVVIPHPVADNDSPALRVKAEAVVDRIATLLTARPPGD